MIDHTTDSETKLPRDEYRAVKDRVNTGCENAVKTIWNCLDEKQSNPRQLAMMAGVDYPLLTKKLRSSAGFRMDNLSRLAYCDLIGHSCHSLFLGEEAVTELPRLLSTMVHALEQMSYEKRMGTLSMTQEIFRAAKKDARLLRNRIPVSELTNLRLREAAQDRFCRVRNLCGMDANLALRVILSHVESEETNRLTKHGQPVTVSLSAVACVALKLRTSLDYFAAYDYTPYTDLRCFGSDCVITDTLLIRFVSMYIQLNCEDQQEVAVGLLTM